MPLLRQPIAVTAAGRLAGSAADGICAFHGIPYGRPPMGEARFRPPEPAEPWIGTRDVSAFGPIACQPEDPIVLSYPELRTLYYADGARRSEDCLTLTVRTPAVDSGRRPVMVWIHGGAYLTGSNTSPVMNGAHLAREQDVVVVNLNYRLGPLGFLDLEAVGAPAEYTDAGTAGILDMIAGLRWVGKNISAFGGDPDNITIFGESAGAMACAMLLASPVAKNLFRRAILQSGAANFVFQREDSARIASRVLNVLGIAAGPNVARGFSTVSAETLIETAGAFPGLRLPFCPVVGGNTLPAHPLEAIRLGSAAGVDILTGWTLEENRTFTLIDGWPDETDQAVETTARRALESRPGHRPGGPPAFVSDGEVARFVTAYRQLLPDASPAELAIAIDTDHTFALAGARLAEAQAGVHPRVFTYLLSWRSPGFGGQVGAGHAIDIPLVFGTFEDRASRALAGDSKAALKLSARMRASWAAFARTGSPSADGIPSWPVFDSVRRATMVIDNDWRVVNDPDGPRRAMWQDLVAG